MPYIVTALLACAAMAWYFFVFVPSQIEYFVGLRFRTLAVASGQIRSKIESLQQALDSAVRAVRPNGESPGLGLSNVEATNVENYVATLLPDVHLGVNSQSAPGFSLGNPTIPATVTWDSVVPQARAASLEDFDDLILATSDGKVVWQREKTTTRVGNLNEVLNGDTAEQEWLPALSWRVRTTVPRFAEKNPIPETAELKAVNLNGRSSFLFVQGISFSKEASKPLYLGGLVSQKDLQQRAMRIPTAWIVLLTLPVVLLFLAFPFVKLATLTSKERYHFADVIFLTAATILAADIGTTLPFVPVLGSRAEDESLVKLTQTIQNNLKDETDRVLKLAKFIQDNQGELKLTDCNVNLITTPQLDIARCGLWEAIEAFNKAHHPTDPITPGSLELDVVIWVDSQGSRFRSGRQNVRSRRPHHTRRTRISAILRTGNSLASEWQAA